MYTHIYIQLINLMTDKRPILLQYILNVHGSNRVLSDYLVSKRLHVTISLIYLEMVLPHHTKVPLFEGIKDKPYRRARTETFL